MSKIKALTEKHPRYIIALEHQILPPQKVGDPFQFRVKAKLTIPEDGGRFSKQVSTDFVSGPTLEDAESSALDVAISRLLGDKQTKDLVEEFQIFDISSVSFETRDPSAPIAAKSTITVFTENMQPHRIVSSLATGADLAEVEKKALKASVNKALGVK